MELLTREEILGKKELKTQVVPVPLWGGSVTVRELTGDERGMLEASSQRDEQGRLPAAMIRTRTDSSAEAPPSVNMQTMTRQPEARLIFCKVVRPRWPAVTILWASTRAVRSLMDFPWRATAALTAW